MKLYTEEQVRQTFRNGFLYSLTNQLNEDAVIDSLTPIELPSDEEIEKVAEKTLSVNLIGFITGAKWLKEQILNQNK